MRGLFLLLFFQDGESLYFNNKGNRLKSFQRRKKKKEEGICVQFGTVVSSIIANYRISVYVYAEDSRDDTMISRMKMGEPFGP